MAAMKRSPMNFTELDFMPLRPGLDAMYFMRPARLRMKINHGSSMDQREAFAGACGEYSGRLQNCYCIAAPPGRDLTGFKMIYFERGCRTGPLLLHEASGAKSFVETDWGHLFHYFMICHAIVSVFWWYFVGVPPFHTIPPCENVWGTSFGTSCRLLSVLVSHSEPMPSLPSHALLGLAVKSSARFGLLWKCRWTLFLYRLRLHFDHGIALSLSLFLSRSHDYAILLYALQCLVIGSRISLRHSRGHHRPFSSA